jgi:starch-binding outer membrane protein, SusD/RagB family
MKFTDLKIGFGNLFQLCLLPVALCLLVFVSCSKDILNVSPATNNTSNDFYQDENQVNQGVTAIYNALLPMPNNNWLMADVRSDNMLEAFGGAQRDALDFGNFVNTAQTGATQTAWSNLYTQIYRANIVLEKIEPFSFARVPQFKGEARFLRALAYFDLVRYFGDVPLATKVLTFEESKKIQREPAANVYNQIIEDLKFAIANLPETYLAADKGRATKWIAKALLGRVYLTMAGYPLNQADKLALAKVEFADVIAKETLFPMAAVYGDMFKALNDNKFYVFEIQYVSGGLGLGNPAANIMAFQYPSQWSAFQPQIGFDAQITPALVKGWPNLDKRKFATLDTGFTDTKTLFKTTRVQLTKFLEKGSTAPTTIGDQPNNFPLIRFEDVLLMQAEVLNEEAAAPPAQALTYLNRSRKRAGLADTVLTTKAAFKMALEQERQWEFVGEGLRWHDLVRTGRAIEVMNKHFKDNAIPLGRLIDEHDLLYPIPQREILINPGFWKQNPGY